MEDFTERRKYQRCDNVVCETTVNVDGDQWIVAELCDISAAGLRFASEHVFNIEDKLLVHLVVYNMLSEFKIKVSGSVIRIDHECGKSIYVIKYKDINKHTLVLLDELVRSGLLFKNSHEHLLNEEQYSLLLLPRFGLKNNKSKR